MTDIKMSNTFDLPVSDGDFTLVAMNKSTYVSMDRAAVIAINSYDLNQERIAELEKELFKQSQESKGAASRAIEIILEKDDKIAELEKERDALSLAQFVYAYYMEKNSNPIDLYNWMVEWGYLTKKEQGK